MHTNLNPVVSVCVVSPGRAACPNDARSHGPCCRAIDHRHARPWSRGGARRCEWPVRCSHWSQALAPGTRGEGAPQRGVCRRATRNGNVVHGGQGCILMGWSSLAGYPLVGAPLSPWWWWWEFL